jgi:hypothetical protein
MTDKSEMFLRRAALEKIILVDDCQRDPYITIVDQEHGSDVVYGREALELLRDYVFVLREIIMANNYNRKSVDLLTKPGTERDFKKAYRCPNCWKWYKLWKKTFVWRVLRQYPALEWACHECGYIEGPMGEDLCQYSPVKSNWLAWIAEDTSNFFVK